MGLEVGGTGQGEGLGVGWGAGGPGWEWGRELGGTRLVPGCFPWDTGGSLGSGRCGLQLVPRVWLPWETTSSSLIAMGYRRSVLPWDSADPKLCCHGLQPALGWLLWDTTHAGMVVVAGRQLDPGMVMVGYSRPGSSHRSRHTG